MPSGASRAAIRSASAALAGAEAEIDPPDPVGAEIGFADQHDIAVAAMAVEIGARRRTRRPPRRRTGRPGSSAAAGPACMIRCAAAAVIATPAALSIAPVPRSQLSRWPPITITPALGSLPGTSATTLPDWRRPMLRGVSVSRIRTGGRRRGEDALQLLGVGDGQRAGRDRPHALRRSSARRYADCGDGRCRSSG